MSEGRYSRVYHCIEDDPRLKHIYPNDENFAAWMRLLMLADQTWPQPAPLPRSVKDEPLAALIEAGVIELVGQDRYRFHGLDKERTARSRQARHAAEKRWENTSSAPSNARSNADSSADARGAYMPRREEKRREEKEQEEVRASARELTPHRRFGMTSVADILGGAKA